MKKILVFLFVLISITSNYAQENISGPKIFSPNRFHNFGDLREGQIVSHEFIIQNRGTDSLKIFKVRSSCGCTVAKLKKSVLAPGDSTSILVTFNTKNKKGSNTKFVYIYSNDPILSKFKLVLKANVFDKNANIKAIKEGPRLRVQTYQINFGKVTKGEKKTAKIYYKNIGKLPLKISYVKASDKSLQPYVNRYSLQPGDKGILEINLDSSSLQGSIARTIAIKSNDPLEPTQIITVFVEIKKDNKDKK